MKHHNKVAQSKNTTYDCFDCEQLVNVVYRDVLSINIRKGGYGLSTTTKVFTSEYGKLNIINKDNINEEIKNIKAGDILFFHTQSLEDIEAKVDNRYPGHVGIYLGNYKFIHARTSLGRVAISKLTSEKYLKKLVGYKDIISTIEKDNKKIIKSRNNLFVIF